MIKKRKTKKRNNPTEKAKNLAESIASGPVKFLGEGVDGEVYNYQNKYAIKIFHKPISDKIDLNKYVKYNLMLSKYGLIPQVYEITPQYILMKYINVSSLKELIPNLTYLERIKIYETIKRELQKWHGLNVTHGDLNSKNILVISLDKVMFIDFL